MRLYAGTCGVFGPTLLLSAMMQAEAIARHPQYAKRPEKRKGAPVPIDDEPAQ